MPFRDTICDLLTSILRSIDYALITEEEKMMKNHVFYLFCSWLNVEHDRYVSNDKISFLVGSRSYCFLFS